MDLYKTLQISTDYKDHKEALNWERLLFAPIILVDKTRQASPLIYQLSDQKFPCEQILNLSKNQSLNFSRNAFIFIGEALVIDKKMKKILLCNKNSVEYDHLIIASGKKTLLAFQDEELIAALQALNDALRMKSKIPASFPPSVKSPSPFFSSKKESTFAASDHSILSQGEQLVKRLVHPYIMKAMPKFDSFSLDAFNNRFYEVQT